MIRSQRGTTLVEMMVAVAILTTMSLAVMSAMNYFAQSIERTRTTQQRDKRIQALLENLRTNLSFYQANYSFNAAAAEAALNVATLPLAWNQSTLVPAASCPSCPGRLGYVIHAVDSFPGMFRVVVRVTNPELFQGHKDYEFVVNSQ